MKDIPLFTTQFGAAGLTLREVSYNQKAYITVHDTQDLPQLLEECAGFCRAVGAREIFACNHPALEQYPISTQIFEMERTLADLPKTDAKLQPVTGETLSRFVEIYNQKMRNVAAAKYMTAQDAQKLLTEGGGYFVLRGERLIGFGIVADGELSAMGSLQKGAGREVLLALCAGLPGQTVHLEVASTNEKAIRLYEALGFLKTGVKNTWYKIA